MYISLSTYSIPDCKCTFVQAAPLLTGNPGIFGAGAGEPEGAFESAASLAMSLTSVVMSDEILSASDLFTSRLVQVLKGGKERRT